MARVFHAGRITWPEHRAQAKLQDLLRTADQHDVARIAAHAPADSKAMRHAVALLPSAAGAP